MAYRHQRGTAAGFAAALACAAFSPAAAAPEAPKLQVRSLEKLATPLPYPYNDRLSPQTVDAQIDAAFARARKSGKRVIVDLGGNWCGWCRILAAVMDLPEARPFMDAHFEVISVATTIEGPNGLRPVNTQVLRRFKVKDNVGVPWLVVVEQDGTIVASSDAVTDDSHHTPQKMINWLAKQAKDIPVMATASPATQKGGV